MTTKPDGGPAFPLPIAVSPTGDVYQAEQWPGGAGMSLRDYAAIQFIAGMFSNPTADRGVSQTGEGLLATYVGIGLRAADAFIVARGE